LGAWRGPGQLRNTYRFRDDREGFGFVAGSALTGNAFMNPTAMALLLIVGWGVFAYSAHRRWKLMRVGTEAHRFDRPALRIRSMLKYAFAQFRMRRYPISGMAHTLVFVGFLVLLLRSLMLWGRGFEETFDLGFLDPHGWPGVRCMACFKDFFAVLVTVGALDFLLLPRHQEASTTDAQRRGDCDPRDHHRHDGRGHFV